MKLNILASILSQKFNNYIIYPDENNIWIDKKSIIIEKEDDNSSKSNIKFMNYKKNQFLKFNDKFSSNFQQFNNTNTSTNNINLQNNNLNKINQDYFIEEHENLITNQINNMNIKPNNLTNLNDINVNGMKSFTDPSLEEFCGNNKYPSFLFSPSDQKTKKRIFPVIEENNRIQAQEDDSFDYTNLNEE